MLFVYDVRIELSNSIKDKDLNDNDFIYFVK